MVDPRDPDDAPAPDLLEAIEAAARQVGSTPGATQGTPVVVRLDGLRPGRARVTLLVLLLVASVVGTAYLSYRPPGEPSAETVEADLRWAVAQVVRRVEGLRLQTGRLPDQGDLRGLVSDLVVYEPLGDGYWVFGQRGSVRVEFDGTVPLDTWERLRVY